MTQPIRSVLLPVDGTPGSDGAVRWARALRDGGSMVTVVTVAEPAPGDLKGHLVPPDGREGEDKATATHLERVRRQLEEGGLSPAPEVRLGLEARARFIVSVAEDVQADLIVMGLGRRSLGSRLFRDLTTMKVARLSQVPVLAVPPDASGPARRLVVATDLSPPSRSAAAFSAQLVAPGGSIELVHVLPGALHGSDDPKVRRIEADLTARLVTAAGELGDATDLEVRGALRYGGVESEILAAADECEADLVALGSHGHGFVDRLLLGSTTSKILDVSERAVLVVPSPGERPD